MSLRTNSNKVKEALREHVLEHFSEDYGWENPDRLANLKEQMRAFDHLPTAYKGGLEMAIGGTFLIYYYDQRKFLEDLLEQTDTESDKYSNHRVFETYCHLIARTVAELVA